MKNLFYFSLLFLLSCKSQKEVVVEKHSNGEPKVVHEILSVNGNDTLEQVTGYRKDNTIEYVGFLRNGEADSTYTYWYEKNVQIMERTNFQHGKKNGSSAMWYPSGKKMSQVNYADDLKQGTETGWYENGNMKWEGTWDAGKEVEFWTYWYENGNKKEEGYYRGGNFDNSDPNIKPPGKFIPYKDNKWSYWKENGELIKIEYWEQGNLKDK